MSPEHRPEEDEVLRRLGELPARDVDATRAEQLRRRAHEALARSTDRSWLGSLERVYTRALEPALVVGISSVYLVWAFRTVSELLLSRPIP